MSNRDQEVEAFLDAFLGFRERPSIPGAYVVEGELDFAADLHTGRHIADRFELRFHIPRDRNALPEVWEIGGRIPREVDFHINGDGTLCLGSPLSLRVALARDESLSTFVDRCVIPHLAAASVKLAEGGQFILGELSHGKKGLLEEYERMLGVRDEEAVKGILFLGTLRKRVANKRTCPCGCRGRLGQCPARMTIGELRKAIGRKPLRDVLGNLNRLAR